jgi:hypothetical protein
MTKGSPDAIAFAWRAVLTLPGGLCDLFLNLVLDTLLLLLCLLFLTEAHKLRQVSEHSHVSDFSSA